MVTKDSNSLNILLISQDDPFYVRLFFDEFFVSCARLHEIKGVVLASAMGKKSLTTLARQMYDFYGATDFIKVGFKYALIKGMTRTLNVFGGGHRLSIERLCSAHGISVIHTSKVNSPEFLDTIGSMNLDLVISVAAPVLFKKELILLPKKGCINIHNGMLPKYRGMLPNFWQMYHGEEKVGITVHEINEQLDDGRIILQEQVAIEPGETLDSLIRRTKRIGAHVMIRALDQIRSGTVTYRENPAPEGSYFSFPTREDVREFKRRGKRIM